jgi:hypothetical protein
LTSISNPYAKIGIKQLSGKVQQPGKKSPFKILTEAPTPNQLQGFSKKTGSGTPTNISSGLMPKPVGRVTTPTTL